MTISASFDTSSYIFECCCGERFNNIGAASVCKKCRNYSVWGYTKYVVNILTEEVVHGEMPTDEEYAAAEAAAEIRWAEEAREFEDWKATPQATSRESARAHERCLQEQADAEEDILWDEQERLSR